MENKNLELEEVQNLLEKLQSLLHLWMEGHLSGEDAYILSIATEINHKALQEITRVRGIKYS
ncbi:hypothetical protein [Xenorhabdus kozodoii]|uniref:Uncharacterized protein n=1 Tax=Xenorhabdus kozodoii TaxID=351676 RepID=A0A2D0KXI3_9GAMM|nr:hypothetical protein [Xenorhabdus kozodoii]PHM68141.1 hypothetical protein Xkoz_03732 [Xenorhabdus kozodoii]